jgi:hypothetical protein
MANVRLQCLCERRLDCAADVGSGVKQSPVHIKEVDGKLGNQAL